MSAAVLEECRAALASPNVVAFLRLIREGESAQTDDAYWWLFGSTRSRTILADNLVDHPRKRTYEKYDGQFIKNGKLDYTTATGAYQITETTWDTNVQPALHLPDMTPASQDLAAVYLVRYRGALADVLAGRIEQAIAKCRSEWVSLPGARAGDQPSQHLARALQVYLLYGGQFQPTAAAVPAVVPSPDVPSAPEPLEVPQATTPSPPPENEPSAAPVEPQPPFHVPSEDELQSGRVSTSTQPEQSTMPLPAIAAALLPSLIESIPKLGKLFGAGSAVAERNVAAAELALKVVQEATGTRNAQEAVETVKADPAALQKAAGAIEARWFELAESGGGGIDGARKADAAVMSLGGPWYQVLLSPSFWALLLLIPLVYIIVLSLVGVVGKVEWSMDARAGIAGMITGSIVGGAVGYYWGQTTSRNRSPAP